MNTLNEAINDYCTSTFKLADLLGKSKFSRRQLALTGFSEAKYRWLKAVAKVKSRHGLTPEHIYEASCTSCPRYWTKRASDMGWSALQLRRSIRAAMATEKPSQNKRIMTGAQWVRNLFLVQNEIKRTPTEKLNKEAVSKMLGDIQRLMESK